jgi:uncharacterized membrane protein
MEHFLFVEVCNEYLVQYILRQNTDRANEKENRHRKSIRKANKSSHKNVRIFADHPVLFCVLITCLFTPNTINNHIQQYAHIGEETCN